MNTSRLSVRLITLILWSPLTLQSQTVQEAKTVALPADVQFAGGQSARIRFELVGNFIFLRARLNDSGPFSFLLDTGATASYLDVQLAKASGLGQENPIKPASLDLYGVKVHNQNFSLRPPGGGGAYSGHTLDGLLGYDFISRFVVDIDYVKRTLTLFSPKSYKYSGGGDVLLLNLLEDDSGGKVPLVQVRIKQRGRATIEGKFIADTAVRSAITFNTPFVDTHELLQSQKTLRAPLGGGAMVRESVQPVGRVEIVRLGRFALKNHVGIFFQTKQGIVASPEFDGVIGAEILNRFRVIFDYSRRRLILEPNRYFYEREEFDMSGLLLAAEGADFKTFKVRRIMEDSIAALAGLREGDVISSVNYRPASSLTLEQVRKMFKRNGRKFALGITRGDQKLRITIRLRRII